VQVSVNDLLILVLFVPLVQLLLGVNGVHIPWIRLPSLLFYSLLFRWLAAHSRAFYDS
jgi:ACR3 family arsenite transporter